MDGDDDGCFMIDGWVCRDDDTALTGEEGWALLDAFLAWIAGRGCSFVGSMGTAAMADGGQS